MKKPLFLITLLLSVALASWAQSRDTQLTVSVTANSGENLAGQAVSLVQQDFSLSYGSLSLDNDGKLTIKVYAGNHHISVSRPGHITAEQDFTVAAGQATAEVSLTLEEAVRDPFSLRAVLNHDAFTGTNAIDLSWNTEAPVFFDDFETYDPFAIQFGEWTGIDADREAAAALIGDYPNRGILQYAQIINPLAVDPVWWYDYPILRPYEGKQYVGFTRTLSGTANDDWLISPAISVGNENQLIFMGKAADQYPERFQVYVTTKLDSPTQQDFTRIDQGNYETADYKGWQQYHYDLSAYAGQSVKFAIRYISEYNRYGSFMLMVDNVYVGQASGYERAQMQAKAKRARRVPAHSADNPNEVFQVYDNGSLVATTEDFSYTISNAAAGNHVLGVKAIYRAAESNLVTTELFIPENAFSSLTINVTAQSQLSPDGQVINLVGTDVDGSYNLTVSGGKAQVASLPTGDYVANIEAGAFNAVQQNIHVEGNTEVSVTLTDRILTPYNITADIADGQAVIKWNQELVFSDSFEDYDDFATGSFGQWLSKDLDQMPVYPIGLGSQTNIVSFPGSGSPTLPAAIAPMVFNPWNTVPAMLPTDVAVQAPTGDKTVIFFSPQRGMADKWLISPEVDIHEGYAVSATLKSYASMYPESVEFCVSTEGTSPQDFTALTSAANIPAEQWTIYETPLDDYVGQRVRIGVHYISYDTFFLQLDDFTVGPAEGDVPFVDYGNVVRYEVYLDGEKVGDTAQPTFTLTGLTGGQHTVGIKAIYQNGESDMAEYVISVTTAIHTVTLAGQSDSQAIFNLSGQRLTQRFSELPAGIYLVRQGNQIKKIQKQ